MSYDVDMAIDTGNGLVSVCQDVNMTYNIAPMIHAAMNGLGLRDLAGKTGAQCIPILVSAVAEMWRPDRRKEFTALNPENGWGDFDGCRKFIQMILDMCRQHPKATLRVR